MPPPSTLWNQFEPVCSVRYSCLCSNCYKTSLRESPVMFSPFVVLLAAIGVEVGATTILPKTRGFHDLPWSIVVLGGYAVSIWMLAVVVRQMSVSVAYAVWSGLGTASIALVGALVLGERLDSVKLLALLLIVVGVVVLNLHTAH